MREYIKQERINYFDMHLVRGYVLGIAVIVVMLSIMLLEQKLFGPAYESYECYDEPAWVSEK